MFDFSGDHFYLLRGQESAGIVTCDGADPPTYTGHKVTSCCWINTKQHTHPFNTLYFHFT